MRRQKMIDVTTELPPTRAEREQFGAAYRRWKRRHWVLLVVAVLGGFVGLVVGGGVLAFRLGVGTFGLGFVAMGAETYRNRDAYRTLFTYIDWSETWGQSPTLPTDPERLPRLQSFGYVAVGLLVTLIGAGYPVG